MTVQYLEYIRENLRLATADLSGRTKGQLTAWVENAQFETGRYKRKRLRIRDPETGEMIAVWNQPIPGKQSYAVGQSIEQISHVEYRTASWRRAVMALNVEETAWLLWCYASDVKWLYQEQIVKWAWKNFEVRLGAGRVSGKTLARLRALIWLAAQDVKSDLSGKDVYQSKNLASQVGVSKTNWSQNYSEHWEFMRDIFSQLDTGALRAVARTRSQQRANKIITRIS